MVRTYKRKHPERMGTTERILAVAELSEQGMSTRQIAAKLGCSAATVSRDLRNHAQSQPGLMTEAHFQGSVIAICKLLGVAWFHPYYSERSVPGYPDLTLCGNRGVLFRELKTEVGKLTRTQEEWLTRLSKASQDADVWRPADLASGRILAELKAIR